MSKANNEDIKNKELEEQQQLTVKKIEGASPPAYFVKIPKGVISGQKFPVNIEGKEVLVTCPDKARPGDNVRVVQPHLKVCLY